MDKVKNDEKQKRKLEIQASHGPDKSSFFSKYVEYRSLHSPVMKREETIEILLNAIIELLRNSMKNDDSMHLIKK